MRTLTQKLSGDTAIDPISLWECMSIDEYAEFEMVMGAKLQKKGGVWWHQIRPYFYRPLFPFVELSPNQSYINFMVFEQPQSYLQYSLSSSFRRRIQKPAKCIKICLIKNVDELIDDVFQVYSSFYERTGYSFRKDRTDVKVFADWARLLFRFRKVIIWGA